MTNQALAFPINGTRQGAAWQPQKYRYWYDNIIDLLLVEPDLNQKQIAQRLSRSPVSIGLIMNSDLFRARYEQRRGDKSKALAEKINGKLTDVAILALELTHDKMQLQRTTVPLPDLVDVADKALTRLGYGAKSAPSAAVNVQINQTLPVSAEDLKASRARILEAQASPALAGSQEQVLELEVSRSEKGVEEGSESS